MIFNRFFDIKLLLRKKDNNNISYLLSFLKKHKFHKIFTNSKIYNFRYILEYTGYSLLRASCIIFYLIVIYTL